MITLLALPPIRPSADRGSGFRRRSLPLDQITEREAEKGGAADAEQIAARNAQLTVAQVLARLSRNDQHGGFSSGERGKFCSVF